MRLILAEDSFLLRDGIGRMLAEEGHDVVVSLTDATRLPDEVERHRPDLVIVDVRMPPTHTDEGLRAAIEIRRRIPGQAVMVLSQYVETRLAADMLAADGSGVGYLLKDRVMDVDTFLDALTRVADGGSALDPDVVRRLLRPGAVPSALTRREHDVLRLMAEGHTNAAIAAALHVSASAVEKHIKAIFGKLGLPDSPGHSRRVLAVLEYLRSKD